MLNVDTKIAGSSSNEKTKIANLKRLKKRAIRLEQRDEKSVLFTEESINNKLLKRLKKSNYVRDNEFAKLFATVDFSFLEENKKISPLKTSFAKKNNEID